MGACACNKAPKPKNKVIPSAEDQREPGEPHTTEPAPETFSRAPTVNVQMVVQFNNNVKIPINPT